MVMTMLAATTLVMVFPGLITRSKTVSLGRAAATLNQSGAAFVGAGGAFDPAVTAPDALLLLQTPVDSKSRQAGFGNFPLVDPRWTLQAATTDGPRITFTYDATQKRPVWAVQDNGAGYDVVVDGTRSAPAEADWTARVNRAGHVGARTSAWVWDYHDAPVNPNTGTTVTPATYGQGTTGGLTITGPDTITAAGTYYWIGNAPQTGSLTIDVAGSQNQAVGVTQVQSPTKAFAPGDNTTVTITLTRAEGGTATKTVSVNIPAGLSLAITGPDAITDTSPASWTATASAAAGTLTLTIEGFPAKSATNQNSLTSDPVSWPAGTSATVTIVATALNPSGTTRATKTVSVQLAQQPDIAIVVAPTLDAGAVVARGSYTFTLVSNNGLSGQMDLTATSSDGQTANGSRANTTQLPVNLTFNPDETNRLDGTITLTGTLSTSRGSKSVSETVSVAIPRLKQACQWTISSPDGTANTLTVMVKQGSDVLYQWTSPAPMASFTTPAINLGAGTYTISGNGVVNGSDLTADDLPLTLNP